MLQRKRTISVGKSFKGEKHEKNGLVMHILRLIKEAQGLLNDPTVVTKV